VGVGAQPLDERLPVREAFGVIDLERGRVAAGRLAGSDWFHGHLLAGSATAGRGAPVTLPCVLATVG
jgi:hypothetical protein